MNTERIIFFDGVCNLCNGAVNFVIDRDKRERFKLAALQSEEAKPFLKEAGLGKDELSTILLYEDGKMYKKSTAALHIARNLDGLWPLLYVFMIVMKSCMVTSSLLKSELISPPNAVDASKT